jgi:creatinine amidohydrolase/Fe(II)-dependent formamide hydrolase-like protein/sterol desaturase/sphingolipid hydroxylase (fatty acid hydroxylase superfamily)
MEQLAEIFDEAGQNLVKRVIYFLVPNERVFIPYLISSFIIAYIVYRAKNSSQGPGEAVRKFVAYAFPKDVYAHPSAKSDYVYFLINGMLYPFFAAPFIIGGAVIASSVSAALNTSIGAVAAPLEQSALMIAVATLAVVLAMDFGVFLGHYLQHRIPLLWEFHKVHHTAEVLTPITVYRMHPVDDILTGVLTGGLAGSVLGVFGYFYMDDAGFTTFGGINVVLFLFYVFGYNLRHTHLWVNYPPRLSHVLLSPAQHQIHHSRLKRHHDCNYGLVFGFWDWAFGTLYIPRTREKIEYGIDTEDQAKFNSPIALYVQPFIGAAKLIKTSGLKALGASNDTLIRISSIAVVALIGASAFVTARSAQVEPPQTPFLEDLTWVEVRTLIDAGWRTAIVPTGGTEQNGPHMALGKHNYVVKRTSGEIARTLGNALVAPVIAYVPEGDAYPPTGHMRFAGTMTVPESVFESLLESAATSLKAHGFTLIAFVGDSGDSQAAQERVAKKLDAAWRDEGVRVIHVGRYYSANGQAEWLQSQGETPRVIGRHAGIRDTSELLASNPGGVRKEKLAPSGPNGFSRTGVDGDPTRATAERGEKLLALKVEAAVAEIRATKPASKRD